MKKNHPSMKASFPERKYNSEAEINRAVVRWINSLPQCYAEKRHAGALRRGYPDITGSISGYRLEIEGKYPGNKPTRLQQHYIDRWKSLGCCAGWFDSVDIAAKIVVDFALEKRIEEIILFMMNQPQNRVRLRKQ